MTGGNAMSKYSSVGKVFLYSLSAWPSIKASKLHPYLSEPYVLFAFGIVTLIGHFLLVSWLFPRDKEKKVSSRNVNVVPRNILYYCCCVFSWSCMVDLIFYLELKGFITGYMDSYLVSGERYFDSAYGVLALLLDYVYNQPLYFLIIYHVDNQLDCRNVVIYWAATMLVSLGTIQHAIFSGRWSEHIQPCTFMNVPYVVAPMYYLIKFCQKKRVILASPKRTKTQTMKVLDVMITIQSVVQVTFNVVRGYAATGSLLPISRFYAQNFEPYLMEADQFGASWPVISMYFSFAAQSLICYGLHSPGCTWVLDLSIINAAFYVYGCLIHLLPQFSSRTSEAFQIPAGSEAAVVMLNLMGAAASIVTLVRCFKDQGYFLAGGEAGKKK